MKAIIFFTSLFLTFSSFANNIIVNGTRFIYPANEKEITVSLVNNASRPAIAQAWLDNGNPKESPDTIKTPFQVTPPVSRLEAKGGQVLRIKLMTKEGIPTDRESLWWLNILDIPPTVKSTDKKDENALQLAIRSRFKFIYRPDGLGKPDLAVEKLIIKPNGTQLSIDNPTPFYITISKISIKDKGGALNTKAIMLAPKSTQLVNLNQPVKSGETLIINNINDYGADVAKKIITK